MDEGWTLEPFEDDDGIVPIERFLDGLSAMKFAALDAALRRVLAVRGLELVRTEWLKAIGGGLHEFRVRHSEAEIRNIVGAEPAEPKRTPERIVLRVFVHFYGNRVVLLLVGYDKGDDPKARRQQREIAKARRHLAQFKERLRRERRE